MNPFAPEKRLWLAVVLRAVENLFLDNKGKDSDHGKNNKSIRQNAYWFLFGNSPELQRHRKYVFENAGVNPKYHKWRKIRRRADEFELSIEY